ncbi:hypothetical protein AGLY_010713 [Aphis glycines]|uniref:Uncharacterized protein n=1 Tax=Aphis glycines TaxID=307491 RepID=A0A6G0TGJ1_APHGL|nr:hypothetical protein AGLY_010713 [Aphis glycines]
MVNTSFFLHNDCTVRFSIKPFSPCCSCAHECVLCRIVQEKNQPISIENKIVVKFICFGLQCVKLSTMKANYILISLLNESNALILFNYQIILEMFTSLDIYVPRILKQGTDLTNQLDNPTTHSIEPSKICQKHENLKINLYVLVCIAQEFHFGLKNLKFLVYLSIYIEKKRYGKSLRINLSYNTFYNLELPKCLNYKYGYDYVHTDCIC